jgi:ankyrin repeat protein
MATHEPSSAWRQSQAAITLPHNLWAAAKANNLAELARLINAGWAIDERDHRGYAPLMLAAYAGHLDAVELLVARGADPNTSDLFGNTVLMGAAFKGHIAIVRQLLAAGADPTIRNHGGLDALGFAVTYGHADVFAALRQYTAACSEPEQPALTAS